MKIFRDSIGLLLASLPAVAAQPQPARPNIVIILADDLGYGDVSANDGQSKIRTPRLDRLASEGVRFIDSHAPSSVCSPTRYALLTGRLAWRSPLKTGVLAPWDAPIIDKDRPTLPGFLQQNGYRTAILGKWHLGLSWPTKDGRPPVSGADRLSNVDFTKPIADGPLNHGFDHYFGVDVPNYPPYLFIENNRTLGIPSVPSDASYNRPGPVLPGWDWTNVLPEITRQTVSYIGEAASGAAPYFLYVPLTSPHFPIVPTTEFRGKSGVGDYGDFVLQTDDTVGRILDAIDHSGEADNTLVIFTSDNGPEVTGEVKPGVYDRVRQFGHSSAGPWRGAKRDLWEGGHRVPFIARWPGKIKPGSVDGETISHVDLFATTAAILGKTLAPEAAPDSFNILPALLGETRTSPLRPFTIHHGINGSLAIRQGEWVFIDAPTGDNNREPEWRKEEWKLEPDSQPGELFNLKEDPRQQHNRFAENPAKVRELKTLLDHAVSSGRTTPGPDLPNDPPLARLANKIAKSNTSATGPWKSGDLLQPADAPKIARSAFSVAALVTSEKPEGIILAQGGARHGYTLYFHEGNLIFALRIDQKLATVRITAPPTGHATRIDASVATDGALTLKWGDQSATAAGAGLIAAHPGDPLSIGSDVDSPVGDYKSPNPLQGSVSDVHITLSPTQPAPTH